MIKALTAVSVGFHMYSHLLHLSLGSRHMSSCELFIAGIPKGLHAYSQVGKLLCIPFRVIA